MHKVQEALDNKQHDYRVFIEKQQMHHSSKTFPPHTRTQLLIAALQLFSSLFITVTLFLWFCFEKLKNCLGCWCALAGGLLRRCFQKYDTNTLLEVWYQPGDPSPGHTYAHSHAHTETHTLAHTHPEVVKMGSFPLLKGVVNTHTNTHTYWQSS